MVSCERGLRMWFEIVHPYEDGNGRVGRALLDMALAQDEQRSMRLYSLSARFMDKRDDYYTALERASSGSMDVTLQDFLIEDRPISPVEDHLTGSLAEPKATSLTRPFSCWQVCVL